MNLQKIYKKIARENNISVFEVKREMQLAIDSVYDKLEEADRECLKNILFDAGAKTPDEFIKAIVKINKFKN